MKIIYKKELRDLAEKLGLELGIRTQKHKESRTQDNEMTIFVGRGLTNIYLREQKNYSKCWEIGSSADSFDYLRKVILNEGIVETQKRRSKPEKIVFQREDYDCGGSMVCTLLLMCQREDVLKSDVYGRLEVNNVDGTKSEKIKQLFEEEVIPYVEIWKSSLKDVEHVIAGGGVCLVSYQAWGEAEEIERLECGHYSIVFDIDDESVWLIDPSYGDEEYMPGLGIGVIKRPRAEFDKLWVDKGTDGVVYEKWLLAVRV
jgi:hypothetical protein